MKRNHEEVYQFHQAVQADDHDQNFPYLWFANTLGGYDVGSLGVDGTVTLEQLKRIVAAWEKLIGEE